MNLVQTRHLKNNKKTPPPFISLLLGFEPLCSQNPFGRNNAHSYNFCHQQLLFPTLCTIPWIIHHGADDFSVQSCCSKWAWTHMWENQQQHVATTAASFPFWGGSDCVVPTSQQTLAADAPCKGNLAPRWLAWDLDLAADQPPLLPPQELGEIWGWFNPAPETPPLWPRLCQCSHPSHPPSFLSVSHNKDYQHFWTTSSASLLNLFIPPWPGSK